MSTHSISGVVIYIPSPVPTSRLMISDSDERALEETELHEEDDGTSDISSTSTLVHSISALGIRDNFAHRYSHKIVTIALGMACAMCCTFFITLITVADDKKMSTVYAYMLIGMSMIEVGLLIIFNVLESRARASARTITIANETQPLLA